MARKWSVFFGTVQSLLKLVRLKVCSSRLTWEHLKVAHTIVVGASCSLKLLKASKMFALRARYANALQICQNWVIPLTLFLLGIFLTTGISPVLSQMFEVNPISEQQFQQIQDLEESGRYYQACGTLLEALRFDSSICQNQDLTQEKFEGIISRIEQQPNASQITGIFGNILQGIGQLKASQNFLERGLEMAKSPQIEGKLLLSLGNTLRAMGNQEQDRQASPVYDYLPWRCVNPSEAEEIPQNAIKLYQKASVRYQEAIDKLPSSSVTQIEAQLNLFSLALEFGDKLAEQSLAKDKINLADLHKINLANLSNNRTKVYLQISLAKSLACLQQTIPGNEYQWQEIINQLNESVAIAKDLKNERTISQALGNLAGLYEYFAWLDEQYQQQQTTKNSRKEALELTQKALYLAQQSEAPDIAYKWQWQLGRLWEAQGNNQEAMPAAIANYIGAVKTLQTLRQDLVVLNQDIQFSFREQVEPIYRKLVDLLLQPHGEAEVSQSNLKQARDVIEALQLAELDNFFREACLDAKPQQIDEVDPTAAVIYTIILDKRLEVILSLPGQDLVHDTATLPENFAGKIEALRKSLIDDADLAISTYETQEYYEFKKDSQQVYEWLFPPKIQSQLKTAKLVEKDDIPTLVFILDSSLRNIPMAALYDGQEYLVEKYATAVAPSLQLLEPKALDLEPQILMAGLSQKAPSFSTPPTWRELKYVGDELNGIEKVVSRNRLLKDSDFIVGNLENELSRSPFNIVHLATHGQFSSNLEETYILDWNNPIYINQLNQLLRTSEIKSPNPIIELLVLSACQTAEGDRRAALGLAGVAVRAGARSTLATLWSINDQSTAEFMSQFYTELVKPKMTRAKALCLVQRSFLQQPKDESYQHPKHWAPFILVGNWM